MPAVREIIEAILDRAPACLAEEWDNIGLQVGDPEAPVSRVLLAVDVTPRTVVAAAASGAQLLLAHHPLILTPLKQVAADDAVGALVRQAIEAGVAIVSMHTNLDVAPGGLCDLLAAALGLTATRPLLPVTGRAVKLVVFVPPTHLEEVREAMSRAGAGRIGNYEECAFVSHGTGSYRPLPGAKPFAGRPGRLEFAEEVRLEMLAAKSLLPPVISAMQAAHPYEEVAYDIYPLDSVFPAAGFGRLGRLPAPSSLEDFSLRAKKALSVGSARLLGDGKSSVEMVAVTSGSGGSLIAPAHRAGAQLLVASDINHHQRLLAEQLGLAILDLGHLATERLAVDFFRQTLAARFGDALDSLAAEEGAEPFHAI